jgi:hypothetical protein
MKVEVEILLKKIKTFFCITGTGTLHDAMLFAHTLRKNYFLNFI